MKGTENFYKILSTFVITTNYNNHNVDPVFFLHLTYSLLHNYNFHTCGSNCWKLLSVAAPIQDCNRDKDRITFVGAFIILFNGRPLPPKEQKVLTKFCTLPSGQGYCFTDETLVVT